MYRGYTPIVHYLSPPVVYYDSTAELWFDGKSTKDLITGLATDEMLFINTKVGGSLMDFEGTVDNQDRFGHFARTRATGKIGELPIGNNYNLSMMWETGSAYVLP